MKKTNKKTLFGSIAAVAVSIGCIIGCVIGERSAFDYTSKHEPDTKEVEEDLKEVFSTTIVYIQNHEKISENKIHYFAVVTSSKYKVEYAITKVGPFKYKWAYQNYVFLYSGVVI